MSMSTILTNIAGTGMGNVTAASAGLLVANRTIATLTAIGAALTLQIYNPGTTSTFSTTSTLIIGPTEVVLVDTQFQTNDTEQLVKMVKATGKKLKFVYNSQGDPDFYFGNEVIQKAFPDCKFYATADTIAWIENTKDAKLKYWAPVLKENAPKSFVVPQPLQNNSFTVDGYLVEIKGMNCWVPSLKAVLCGPLIFGTNVHLWLADDQTPELRRIWRETLTRIENMHPDIVVPGHFYPGSPFTVEAIHFNKAYLSQVDQVVSQTNNSEQFIKAMKALYPTLGMMNNLELGAKVLKGEMKWG